MLRCTICSGSNVSSEYMFALSRLGRSVNSCSSVNHCNGDYVFSVLKSLSTSPSSTLSISSRVLKVLFFRVALHLRLTMFMSISDHSLAIRVLIIPFTATIHRAHRFLSATPCRTAAISMLSAISHQYNTSSRTHFHLTTVGIFPTNAFSSHY